jgi:formamidopyrimidine-DNA glycosylase
MPELPEVETMVRGLRPALVSRTIRSLKVIDPHLLSNCDAPTLERKGRGAVVSAVNRRGKWVVIELDGPRGIIVIQPRMTGAFYLQESELALHIRLTLSLTDADPHPRVHYNDPRRLGRIAWYPDPDAAEAAFSRSHGPDALVITADDLAARLSRTTRPIKPTLLDQKVLAGIGNIYADEVLFAARLHPLETAGALDAAAVRRLHGAIKRVLGRALAARTDEVPDQERVGAGGRGAAKRLSLAVFQRDGQPCRACRAPLVRTVVATRGTYLCPRCQAR